MVTTKASLRKSDSIVVLTGAGISAESGVKTFRDSDGLWENHRVEDVASPTGFARDPELVHAFYNARRRHLRDVKPNAAHEALAQLEAAWYGPFTLITQNVDDLHARAGSQKLLTMHGQLLQARCQWNGKVVDWREDMTEGMDCPICRRKGCLRPHIVWFGEMPLFMDEITSAVRQADLFISIGTSGNVYPAAGLISMVSPYYHSIEINVEETAISPRFDEHLVGPASVKVPELVRRILGSSSTH